MNDLLKDIKYILLDVDDTVMDFEKGQKKAFFLSCEELGYSCTEEQYDEYDLINKKYWRMFERKEIEKQRLIFARFEEFFERFAVAGDAVKMEHSYQKHLGDQYFFLDGARDGVDYLKKRGYVIFLATNGVKVTQENRIGLSGLDKIADGVFISEAVGAGKPTKEYYDYVFAATGADRNRSVMVGDSLTSDILGGINAGIRTVWFNWKGKASNPEIVPTVEVRTWEALKALF